MYQDEKTICQGDCFKTFICLLFSLLGQFKKSVLIFSTIGITVNFGIENFV